MIKKPNGCAGCPLEHESTHYVPDDVREGSEVFILGQNPGRDEEIEGTPFCGDTGKIMDGVFLPLAGLQRSQVSVGNTLRCRVGGTNDLPRSKKVTAAAAQHCRSAYLSIPSSVKLIVAQGSAAWNFTQGRHDLSITDWRGHLGPHAFENRPVYGVLHLADLAPNRDPRMTLPSKLDWRKIPSILSGARPLPLPPRLTVGVDSQADIDEWFLEARVKAPYIAWDTEYIYDEDHPQDPNNYTLTMVSAGYPGMSCGIQMVYIHGDSQPWQKADFIRSFYNLVMEKPNVFHNAKAEMRSTQKTWGWNPERFWGRFEDTMLAHAVRWSELPHHLGFLESIYSPFPKTKHLPTSDPLRNWGDTVTTIYAWEALKDEFSKDPGSESVYRTQSLPLVPIIYRREQAGLRVHKENVEKAVLEYTGKLHRAGILAQSYCGWPINIDSPSQVGLWLYDMEGHKQIRGKKTKRRTVDADAIATMRNRVLPFDSAWESDEGIGVDYVEQRVAEGAHPLLEAVALHSGAEQAMSHYLTPLLACADGV